MRTRMGATLSATAIAVVVLFTRAWSPGPAVKNEPGQASVTRVVDGDTIEVQIDDHLVLVRLLGVDAPETVHPSRPEQCFGQQASDRLTELLPAGSLVELTRDRQARDHFSRLLLYVHLTDGLFVNEWLLDEGLAAVAIYEPNTYHRIPLTRAALQAERNQVGLWGACEGPDQPLP